MSAGVYLSRPIARPLLLACALTLLNACSSTGTKPETEAPKSSKTSAPPPMMQQIVPGPIVLKEGYLAKREPESRLNSLTFVQNPIGAPWLFVADANTDDLVIFDAPTGRFLKRFGKRGNGPSEFDGVSGISQIEATLFVSEQNNRRVQVFYLPDIKPMASFGANELKSPRGVYARSLGLRRFQAYVTDVEAEQLVVKIFEVSYEVTPVMPTLDRPYGYDTNPTELAEKLITTVPLGVPAGTPVSIQSDPANERVLIAYAGKLKQLGFSGEVKGEDIVLPDVQGAVSGIGLFACPNDGQRGYWIVSDRGTEHQDFRVYDRTSFAPLTFFRGEQIRDSAAMTFTMESMAFFTFGATFAVHSGTAVGSLSWEALARQTGLRRICL